MKSFIIVAALALGLSSLAVAEKQEHKDHQHKAAPTTQASAPVNTMCPVSNEEIDPDITVQHEGKTIAFCCKHCVAKFKKNPEKYMQNLK